MMAKEERKQQRQETDRRREESGGNRVFRTQARETCGSGSGSARRRIRTRALTVLFLSLLVSAAALFCDNFPVLRLPAEERGVFSVAAENGTAELSGRYVNRLSYRIAGEIRVKPSAEADWVVFPAGTRTLDLKTELQTSAASGTEGAQIKTVYDSTPAYLTTQYLSVRDRVDRISVEALVPDGKDDTAGAQASSGEAQTLYPLYDLSGISFADFTVINLPRANPYLGFFAFGTALCGFALLLFWREFAQKPQRVFLLLCLALGSVMVVTLPRNKVGYDEETHLQAVMTIASLPAGMHVSDTVVNDLIVTDYNAPGYQPSAEEEMRELDDYRSRGGDYRSGANAPAFAVLPNRVPAYLAMAAAVKLGKLCAVSWPGLLMLARFGNLLMYAALMYAAIRRTPCGKFLLLTIALFPQNLFLASTCSYDPFVTGCLSLGMASLLRQLSESRFSWGNFAGMLSFFALGCLPKAVYAPLILAALLLPGALFRGRRQQRTAQALVLLCFLLMLASFILPTVVAPAETGDLRGGATSEVSQVGFILQNPFAYARILLWKMLRWIPQCFIGPDCTVFMGHLQNGYTGGGSFLSVSLCLMLLAVLTERRQAFRTAWQRVWIFLLIGASSVLVWTSMYVAYTEPGASDIAGVQGRYFIPMIFPLYLLLLDFCRFAGRKFGKQSAHMPQEEAVMPLCTAAAPGANLARPRDLWYDFAIRTAGFLLLFAELSFTIFRVILLRFCM